MKLTKTLSKMIIAATLILNVGCTVTTSSSVGMNIDTSNIAFKLNNNGALTDRTDKTFSAGEVAQIEFKAGGLKIVNSKVKFNQDLIVKYQGKEVINDVDAMGKEGKELTVEGATSDSSETGTVPLYITLPIPQGVSGDVTVNVTVRDLNAPGSSAKFETNIIVK